MRSFVITYMLICYLLIWAGFAAVSTNAAAQSIPAERQMLYREQALDVYDPFTAEEMWKRIKIPPSPALSPAQALRSFQVSPGFRIETVAAEPLIEDPVMFEFDPDGRIWAVEMRGYMQDIDGSTEGDPIGQIVVLEDTDGDTFMDKSTVFLGSLVMARTVSFVHGGVLIQEPPNVWFCEDTDGDLKCDRRRLVGQLGVPSDPQHIDNGLFHAMDNWMYNASSRVRHKFIDGTLIEEDTIFRGQWGMSQDDYGRLWYCYEARPIHVDLVASELMYRNRNFQHRLGGGRNSYGLNVSFGEAAREVYPTRVTPGITLGGRELRDDGTLRTFTMAAGISIYRGDQFPPEYDGCAVIPEAAGNLVRLAKLTSDDGVQLNCSNYFFQREWVASTDERFRPVYSRTGPDGSVYICDMYKGIMEHTVGLMAYLRRYIEKQGLEQPVGLGRIYRIRYEGKPLGKVPKLSTASSPQLVEHLSHANGWWRDTSQRLLVERKAVDQTRALGKLVTGGQQPLGRLHALWTLEGIGQLDWTIIRAALADRNAMVRATAVRLAARFAESDDGPEVLKKLLGMSADDRPMVRLQLLFSLGAFRDAKAERVMADIVSQHPGDIFHAAAVSGLEGRELEFVERLLNQPQWQQESDDKRGLLAMLAMTVFNEHDAKRVSRLLALISAQHDERAWRRDELLTGVLSSHFSRAKWPEPLALPQRPELLEKLRSAKDDALDEITDRLARIVTWPGDTTVRPQKPNPRPLTDAEQKQFALGQAIFAVTCHACHHHNGQGQAGKAPPLVESDWVNGPPERLVRIALQGVAGPIKVGGQDWNLAMPGLGQSSVFSDQRMAAVLTYVRRAWGNWGDPIQPDFVAEVRQRTAGRTQMWTAAELINPDEGQPTPPTDIDSPVTPYDPMVKYRDALDGGDAERGRVLFHSNLQLRCPACHIIGQTGGGFVGPELSDVGLRAERPYLLESLVKPSAKIVEGFETIVIVTSDGKNVSGTLIKEDDEQIVIAPPTGGKLTVAVPDIEARFASPVSSMPPVAELFTPEQISDLIEYLSTLKEPTPKQPPR